MKNQILAASAITLFSSLNTATADKIESPETAKSSGTTVITVSRTPIELEKAMAAVTVITRDDIEQSGTTDIVQLLRQQVGLDITGTGGAASTTSVFLRGVESDGTLVLIDGVRINRNDNTGVDWQVINIDSIERVEIVRGPKAALYGSDAIGGVINITTRKTNGVLIKIGGGSFQTGQLALSAGLHGKYVGLNADISHDRSLGFDASSSGFSDDDRDGYIRQNIGAKLSITPLDNIELLLGYKEGDLDAEYDDGVSSNEYRIASAKLVVETDRAIITASASNNKQQYVSISPFGPFLTDSEEDELGLQVDIDLPDESLLTIGGAKNDRRAPKSSFGNADFSEKAAYLQWQKTFGQLQLNLAGRHLDNDRFGKHQTGSAAVGYAFSSAANVFATYGSAFRAPSISELATGATATDLQPERSTTAELGLKGQARNVKYSVTLFDTKYKNMISYNNAGTFFPVTADDFYENVDKTSTKGVEAMLAQQLGSFDWTLNYTFLDTEDNDGNDLLKRPENKANLILGYNWNKLGSRTALNILASSKRDDFGGVELHGYAIASLTHKQQFSEVTSLGLRVENVFDTEYEQAAGFNTGGRAWYINLTQKIK